MSDGVSYAFIHRNFYVVKIHFILIFEVNVNISVFMLIYSVLSIYQGLTYRNNFQESVRGDWLTPSK